MRDLYRDRRAALPYLLPATVGAAVLVLAWVAGRGAVPPELAASVAVVRDKVAAFGWWGPALYVALVVCRPLQLIPSGVLLATGGAVFGTALGSALGALGVVVSGMLWFWLARTVGRDRLWTRAKRRLAAVEQAIATYGASTVALGTAHPIGPMLLLHLGAGLSKMRGATFVAVLVPSALVRASVLSAIGATLGG